MANISTKQFFNSHPVFRYQEFEEFMQADGVSRKDSCNRLLTYYRRKGRLSPIRRLLYAVNSETETKATDPFLIAARASDDAILAYHTALELHGLAYTTFETLFYLSEKLRHVFSYEQQTYRSALMPKSLITQQKENFAVDTIRREGLDINITSLERTMVDVLDRPELSGGWEEVMRSLEHVVSFDAEALVEYALLLNKASIIAKLGFFLDQLPEYLVIDETIMKTLLKHIPKQPYYMVPKVKHEESSVYLKKWQLIVPKEILEKQWEEPHVDDF